MIFKIPILVSSDANKRPISNQMKVRLNDFNETISGRVLVCLADSVAVKMVTEDLMAMGADEVVHCESKTQVNELLHHVHKFDAVILDLDKDVPPDWHDDEHLHGYGQETADDAVNDIRREHELVTIVLVSSLKLAIPSNAQFVAVITKPFFFYDLFYALKTCCVLSPKSVSKTKQNVLSKSEEHKKLHVLVVDGGSFCVETRAESIHNNLNPNACVCVCVIDVETNMKILTKILSKAGHVCTMASNGQKCLDVLDKANFAAEGEIGPHVDAVLLDLMVRLAMCMCVCMYVCV